MHTDVTRGQEAEAAAHAQGPDGAVTVEHVEFTDAELEEIAQDNLDDAVALTEAVADAIERTDDKEAKAGDRERRLLAELHSLSLSHQPVASTTAVSVTASRLLQVRTLQRIESHLGRIAAMFERSEQAFTAELGGSSEEVKS